MGRVGAGVVDGLPASGLPTPLGTLGAGEGLGVPLWS